jgi:predicted AAA+ superfamily ATPase
VGKTTMLERLYGESEEVLWLNADEQDVREKLSVQTVSALAAIIGDYKTVIIDKIQRIENAGLLLKICVDQFRNVQFIATGSSALEISETIFEPLTGRHYLFHLYPFSLSELYAGKSPFEIERQLPFHLVFGSYPEVCMHRAEAEIILKNLASQYLYKDVLVWKDIRKPQLLDKLLKMLAWQICSEVSIHELAVQLQVKSETVESYIDLLEKSFVVYRLPSYSTNPRKELTKMMKIYFWDNGVRNMLINNFNNLSNRNDHGQLWENFIISERLKQLAWGRKSGQPHFWRNRNQSEVDYVETDGDEIRAYEMKWSSTKKAGVTRAFTNMYPHASTQLITPQHCIGFAGVKDP